MMNTLSRETPQDAANDTKASIRLTRRNLHQQNSQMERVGCECSLNANRNFKMRF